MKERAIILAVVILIILYKTTLIAHIPSKKVILRVSTTTSLYATGLLDTLGQKFETEHSGISIQFIAVGSGQALKLAEHGDVCAVLVHAPALEKQYIDKNIIADHVVFAYNYFVIIGPENDPAHIKEAKSAVEAFKRIYWAGENGTAHFVSRGDKSGTHLKELQIWNKTGLDPHGKPWYLESGQGMGQTLVMASEKQAYTLSDIGTYLKFHYDNRIPGLTILYWNDTNLINIYSGYIVSYCNGKERNAAEQFLQFLVSSEGQNLIKTYGLDKYHEPLFYSVESNHEQIVETWNKLAGG